MSLDINMLNSVSLWPNSVLGAGAINIKIPDAGYYRL